jgi:2-polyprenyl-3-methyl-5-hydroxy-6-metoxy-1,4-benzoquinol methylase
MSPVEREEITDPRIRAILDEIDGGRVLDVGCVQHNPEKQHDPNWLHQHLYEKADQVLGVDIDETAVDALQSAGFNIATADAEQLDVEGKYDYVVAGELIEHLANTGKFLDSAKDSLDEGGKLILTTPNPWCWAHMKNLIRKEGVPCNPEHTHYHDETTLNQLLKRYNLETEIRFIGPRSEGITRRLYKMPLRQLRRLGATQLLAVAEVKES